MESLNILTGAFLKDHEERDFLLVVDVEGELRSAEDAAMFHTLVTSDFDFPVVLAWQESDGWHMGGVEPWKSIAGQTDPTTLRLQKIPVSNPETLKWIEDQERKLREG